MRRRVAAVLGCVACAPPTVAPPADRAELPAPGTVAGEVVYTGPSRGRVVLLLYDASRPPPPRGTGRPVNFAVMDGDRLFGDRAGAGPFTASFQFGSVPAGRYLVTAFLDADTCAAGRNPCHAPDFIPWYGVTAEPNAGDVAGGHVDVATRALRCVAVLTDAPECDPAAGVAVLLSESAATIVPLDRPAYVAAGGPLNPTGPTDLLLTATPIAAPPVNQDAPFLIRYTDEDGQLVLWPRVFVRKLADESRDPSGLRDENDLNRDGVLDPDDPDDPADAVTYPHDGTDPAPGVPDLVLLAAAMVPDPAALAQLNDPATGRPDVTRRVPVRRIAVRILPVAVDAANPAVKPVPLKSVPDGRYAVIVQQFTGQTWRLPNELGPCARAAGCPGLAVVEGQDWAFQVRK